MPGLLALLALSGLSIASGLALPKPALAPRPAAAAAAHMLLPQQPPVDRELRQPRLGRLHAWLPVDFDAKRAFVSWAFSYADPGPYNLTTPEAQLFLLTNIVFFTAGGLVGTAGGSPSLGLVYELAGVASVGYHLGQVTRGGTSHPAVQMATAYAGGDATFPPRSERPMSRACAGRARPGPRLSSPPHVRPRRWR